MMTDEEKISKIYNDIYCIDNNLTRMYQMAFDLLDKRIRFKEGQKAELGKMLESLENKLK